MKEYYDEISLCGILKILIDTRCIDLDMANSVSSNYHFITFVKELTYDPPQILEDGGL